MTLLPLYGHHALRQRLRLAAARGALPASLLIHGPLGVGKQRLALWLGQLLLCQSSDEQERPCGRCTSCRYVLQLVHPDLRWFFPRPRLAGGEGGPDEALEDYAEALAERARAHGVYERPSGSEGIFVGTVRAIVQRAALTPSLGRRKVFIVGDAERMVPQEGAEAAANAFLKLLEEPPEDTTIIITSSEPGALLPTIRSRVVSLRASPLSEEEMRVFAADVAVSATVGDGAALTDRLRAASGSPGALIGAAAGEAARSAARDFLAAVGASRGDRMRAVLALGGSRARGFFSDMLDALTTLLHERAREEVARGAAAEALSTARAVEVVEEAKALASGNVNPQLIGASVAKELATLLD